MSEIQYQATIENGEIKTEEGYFFKAGNFEVQANTNVFKCQFNRLSNGEVIWEVLEGENSVFKLTHPDYVPEINPGQNVKVEDLPKETMVIFDAFGKLDISKDKDYKLYFAENKNNSYKIVQLKKII